MLEHLLSFLPNEATIKDNKQLSTGKQISCCKEAQLTYTPALTLAFLLLRKKWTAHSISLQSICRLYVDFKYYCRTFNNDVEHGHFSNTSVQELRKNLILISFNGIMKCAFLKACVFNFLQKTVL